MSTVVADFVFKKTMPVLRSMSKQLKGKSSIEFFRIPKDDTRCAIWKAIFRVDELNEFTSEQCYSRFRICSKHFGSDMFSNVQKKRLKREAVPTGSIDEIHPAEQDTSVVDNTEMSKMSEDVAGTYRGRQTYEDGIDNPVSHDDVRTTGKADFPASKSTETRKRVLSPVPGTSSLIDYELQYSDTSDAYIQTSTSLSANTPRKQHLQNKRVLQRQLHSNSSQPSTSNQQDSDEMEVALNFIKKSVHPL